GAGGAPDVKPEADSQGRVARRAAASSARAIPVAAPQQQRPRNFFERLFGVKRQPAPPPPPPPTPKPTTTRSTSGQNRSGRPNRKPGGRLNSPPTSMIDKIRRNLDSPSRNT